MMRPGPPVLFAVLALTPAIAAAHAHLVASDPAHQAELDAPPSSVRLQFSEPVEAAFAKLDLRCDGKSVSGRLEPLPSRDRRSLAAKLPGGVGGACVLAWSIVARDGHRTRGEFRFRVGPR